MTRTGRQDGYKFKLYLEGIRVPFISASINIAGAVPTALIEMLPSDNFYDLPSGALVHIFFRKLNANVSDTVKDNNYKLLFSGTLSGKGLVQNGSQRAYTISAYGRLAIMNNLSIWSALPMDGSPCAHKSLSHGNALSGSEMQTAAGVLSTKSLVPTEYNANITKNGAGFATGLGEAPVAASGTSEIIKETKDAANPGEIIAGKLTQALETPDLLKQIISYIISVACNESSEFNAIAYHYRLRLKDFIAEMPPTWANYIASLDSGLKRKYSIMINNLLASTASGGSNVSVLIDTLLKIYFCELYEIPGLDIGGALITPEYLNSDVPACNMIFPSSKLQINYSDNDANKITRVMTQAHVTAISGNITPTQNSPTIAVSASSQKNVAVSALAMYPDVFKISKDLPDAVTEPSKASKILVSGEEFIGTRLRILRAPSDMLMTSNSGAMHQDMTEQTYYLLSTAHRSLSLLGDFMPNLIPGQKAILFDKHVPLIFKIASLSHRIGNFGDVNTSVYASQIERLDKNYKPRHPHWYDMSLRPENISDVYESYFGCPSMMRSADKSDMLSAYKAMYEKYESCEIKSYMAEKLTERFFDSESEVFSRYGATAAQQDNEGVIIYQTQGSKSTFDSYEFDGYDLDMNRVILKNDRQGPILEYVKTIYGIIGDRYD